MSFCTSIFRPVSSIKFDSLAEATLVWILTLTAEELYHTFVTDRVASGEKFNGKMVAISGILNHVEATDSMTIGVFVFDHGMFGDEGIRCIMLEKYKEDQKKFQAGNNITIKGFCSGYNNTDVILEYCSIYK